MMEHSAFGPCGVFLIAVFWLLEYVDASFLSLLFFEVHHKRGISIHPFLKRCSRNPAADARGSMNAWKCHHQFRSSSVQCKQSKITDTIELLVETHGSIEV